MNRHNLGDVLLRSLTRRAPGAVERLEKKGFDQWISWLEKKHPGIDATTLVGVSATTLRRWRKGTQRPSVANLRRLRTLTRHTLIPAGRRSRIARSTYKHRRNARGARAKGGAVISATVRISRDTRKRDLDLGANLPEGRLDTVVQAYITGGEAAASTQMLAMIAEYFDLAPADVAITDVKSVDLSPYTPH